MNLEEFLSTYPDTDTNRQKDGRLVIEAYNQEGDIIDVYLDGAFAIEDYFESKFDEFNTLKEFNNSYSLALDAIKEDLDL
jgi:hypothetical protein